MISAPGVGFFKSTLSSERYYQSAQRLIRPLDLNRSPPEIVEPIKSFQIELDPNGIHFANELFHSFIHSFVLPFLIWDQCYEIALSLVSLVGAQLADRLLPNQEDPGSNTLIGHFYSTFSTVFFKMGHSLPLFLYFRLFNTVDNR